MSTNVEKPKKSLFYGEKGTTSEKKPKPEKAVKGKKASAEKKQKAPKQKKEWKELETAQHPQQDRCMFPGAYCVYGDHRCVSIPEIRRRISEKFTDSTLQTMRMTTENLNMSCDFIRSGSEICLR